MDNLLVEVLAGIIVAVLSGLGGFYVRKRFFGEDSVLPRTTRHFERESYRHLNGKWHLYWVSYHPSKPTTPYWFHGVQRLEISGSQVRGGTVYDENSPLLGLRTELKGEIRAGKMIVLDACIQDETEFASVIYPNLRSKSILLGIWNGRDNLLRPVSAPSILSRKEMSSEELNEALLQSDLIITPISAFYLYSSLTKQEQL